MALFVSVYYFMNLFFQKVFLKFFFFLISIDLHIFG